MAKHDDDCMRRRSEHQYLCTCGYASDAEVRAAVERGRRAIPSAAPVRAGVGEPTPQMLAELDRVVTEVLGSDWDREAVLDHVEETIDEHEEDDGHA